MFSGMCCRNKVISRFSAYCKTTELLDLNESPVDHYIVQSATKLGFGWLNERNSWLIIKNETRKKNSQIKMRNGNAEKTRCYLRLNMNHSYNILVFHQSR